MTDDSRKQPTNDSPPAEEAAGNDLTGVKTHAKEYTLEPVNKGEGYGSWRASLPSLKRFEDKLAASLGITNARDRFLFDTGFNFILVVAIVLPVDLLFQYATQDTNSLSYYQTFMTHLLIWILSLAGVNAHYSTHTGTPVVSVEGLSAGWEIASACTGLHETLFIGLLVLLFRGVRPRVRVKWAVIFALIIFVETLLRILAGYPMERNLGFATWDRFHFYWWHYGQYAFIMLLFIIWVNTVAYKDILKQRKQKRKGQGGDEKECEAETFRTDESAAASAEHPLATKSAETYSGSP